MALDTTLKVTLDSRSAEQQIQQLTSRNYGIKLNIDSQPLGRITGQLSEFNKSMDAANARVVAFGASAGAIAILEKSFHALIDSTIEVEKALNGIQVLLNASDGVMSKFGKNLFDIAKNTGQSFDVVAEAATNLSRQGLGVEETLKRTNDALILSRLTGMGAAESVRALTAAVNSFSSQAVTATEIVNKFATVDSSFAIGAKDLPEAISRVGSAAAQAGVSLDELIGLVTSAQVATARGGSVIGNSFKTIFTRLERGKTQTLLESLGVDTKDESGRVKSTIDMLKDLAKVYGTLSSGKQAEVAEKVGGVFQINILKAALADLGKEHSVYSAAVAVSNASTDEATKRNEKLNETYAAQINRLQQSATQLAASAGKQVFGPSMDRVIGAGNGILDSLNNIDSSSIGAKLGKGILDGIGQILAGPGLVMIGGVIIKLLGDFSKFAGGSVKELLGLNGASKEQAAIQASITKLLEKNPSLLSQINSEAKTQNDQAKLLLDFYTKQTAEMQKQAALTAEIASKLYTGGIRMGPQGVPVNKKAAGYIPEFASEEAQAKMLGARNPRAMWSSGTIGGQKFIKNSEETEIVGYGRNGDSAVIPKYAAGWVPNFAVDANGEYIQGTKKRKAQRSTATSRKGQGILRGEIDAAGFAELLVPIEPRKSIAQSVSKNDRDILVKNIAVRTFKQGAIKEESRKDAGKIVETIAGASFPAITDYINNLSPLGSPPLSKQDLENSFKQGSDAKGAYGALQAFAGAAFESGITKAIGYHAEKSNANQGDFDVRGGTNLKLLQELFGLGTKLGDFKISDSTGNLLSFAAKVVKEKGGRGAASKIKKAAAGYIPNFADALHESIAREISAGAPADDIYVKKYGQLASANNPDGYGVFNKRDEGSMSKEMGAIRRKGYAGGYIPNFADDGPAAGSGGLVSGGASVLVDFAFAMSIFKNNSKEATEATKQKSEAIAKEKEAQIQSQQAIIKTKEAFIEANKGVQGMADSVRAASRDIGFANQKIEELSKLSLGQKIGQLKDSVTSSGAYQGANKFLSGRGGTALTFAPLIAGQISELIPQTSQGGRGAAQTVSSLGNIASYTGAGAMLGGPVGAGIGLAAGAILEVPKIVESFTTKLPELQKKADKDKDKYNSLDAQSKAYLGASSNYDEALKSGNATPEQLSRLSQAKQSAFEQYSPEQQLKLLEAREKGGSEGENEQAGALSREAGEQALSSQRALKQQTFLEKDKRDITFGSEAAKDAAGALISQITSGKTGIAGLESLKSLDLNQLKTKSGEGQYDTASRLTTTLTKSLGGDNISKEDKQFVENIGNKLATGNSQAAAATMEELAKQISKIKEVAEKSAAADQKDAEQAAEAAAKRMLEAEAIKQNASAIEKQIGLIQAATNAYESQAAYQQQRGSTARKFSAEMQQTRTGNVDEIIDKITGSTMQGTRDQYTNKVSNINQNLSNEQQDIIEKAQLEATKSVNKNFLGVYNAPKKNAPAGAEEIYGQGDKLTGIRENPFSNAQDYTTGTEEERSGYIASLGSNEIRRQSDLGAGVSNAYKQYGEGKSTKEEFQTALSTELAKLADSGKIDSQELRNVVLENVQKGEEMKQAIESAKESAKMEVEKTNQELQKLVVLQGLMASAKTFGGGMTALEGNRITSTPEISSLISAGTSAQKFKDDQQRKINSGRELSSADVGNRNIAENYMKTNRVLRDKYLGGMPTGQNIGSEGAEGAEGLMTSEIQKAMTKDLEETRKSFKGAPKELQVMNTKSENAMIANATGKKYEDVDKMSGGDRDKAMTEALKNIALVKVAQETGDKGLLKGDKTLEKMLEQNKTPDEKLLGVETESKGLLQKIFDQLSKGQTAAEDSRKNPVIEQVNKSLQTPVDYSKYGDDKEWRKGQEAKEREMDRQSRIKKVAKSLVNDPDFYTEEERNLPHNSPMHIATMRVDKQMAKDAEQKKQEQQKQEAAGGKGGGGNVTVAAPQINITVNGGGGGGSAHSQADELHRNVASIAPELQANIQKVVKETFERRINSLEGRMDRVAMSNQSAKPVPLGVDKSSAA
jgi:TP901 family phage tail tape measure protein